MVGAMFHIFLLRQGKIAAHHKFSAENDAWACRVAADAFDACIYHCDDFELWDGTRLVMSRAGLRTYGSTATPDNAFERGGAVGLNAVIDQITAGILQAAKQKSSALRDSPRLGWR
jgi:hypothetical protein